MKRSSILLISLFFLLVQSLPAVAKDGKPWLKWGKRECYGKLWNSRGVNGQGIGDMFLPEITGDSRKTTYVMVTWITDQAAKAMARIRQMDERLTDQETTEIAEKMREGNRGYYALLVEVSSEWHIPFETIKPSQNEVVDTRNTNRIFLQSRKNKDIFLRPVKIELMDPAFKNIHRGSDMPSIGQSAVFFFERDEEFLKKADYEIDFEINQAGKNIRVKLKDPRKMVGEFGEL